MPSGAKKRKAARKKKERENNKIINPSTTNNYNPTQGNDKLKSQDEKGSDGDHFDSTNGRSEAVEKRDPSAVRSFASDVESLEEVPGDVKIELVLGGNEDSVVIKKRDLKSEESYERKDQSFEHAETAKEEHAGGNGGGTSNGQSPTEKNSKDVKYNSVENAIACPELVKSVDSSPSEMNSITKNVSVESKETSGNSAAENSISSVKVVASASVVENSDTGSVSLEKSVVPSVEVTDLALKINSDNVYPLNDENATTSNFEVPMPKEHDSKVLNSSSASPITKLMNGAEHIKNSESPECSKYQPRGTSAPIMVQKTPWWSCCGLIEVLSGSNR